MAVVAGLGAERMRGGVEAGLDDEDVLFPDRFADGDGRLVVGELFDGALGQRDAKSVTLAQTVSFCRRGLD